VAQSFDLFFLLQVMVFFPRSAALQRCRLIVGVSDLNVRFADQISSLFPAFSLADQFSAFFEYCRYLRAIF
jgi:hypothetical protein